MRTFVVTGAAGAGSTTIAAALAHRIAADGRQTLLLSRDLAELQAHPEQPNLQERAVHPLAWAQETWDSLALVRRFLGEPWQGLGGHNVLPLPGIDELAWWGQLREAWRGPSEVVVVDAGPIDSALRWLRLPDTVVGLLRRVWPLADRTGEAAAGLQQGSWHLRAMARIDSEAAELAAALRSTSTSIHLVTTPAMHDLRRVLSGLAPMTLFDFNPTDIIVNRLALPASRDQAVVQRLTDQLPTMMVRESPHESEPVPDAALGRRIYPSQPSGSRPFRSGLGGGGQQYVWTRMLPLIDPAQISAVVQGEDLLLTVGEARRVIPMPSVLRRCTMVSAVVEDQALRLTFEPNPDVWPKNKENA